VAEAIRLVPKLPDVESTKNLFLRDKSGKRHILLVVPNRKQVNLKQFAQNYGFKNLSLASTPRLHTYLGVDPGAVSLLCLIEDHKKAVEVYIDEEIWCAHALACHPLRNDMTIVLSLDDVKKILKILTYQVQVIKLTDK